MTAYRDLSRGGSIEGYECGPRWIEVTFTSGKCYRFSYQASGAHHVEQMKRLARQGMGLHSYIRQKVPQHEE